MKIGKTKRVEVEAKTMRVSIKARDCCIVQVLDQDGSIVAERDGYVPAILPGGPGDYVEMEIDIDTGRIADWQVKAEALQAFIDENSSED